MPEIRSRGQVLVRRNSSAGRLRHALHAKHEEPFSQAATSKFRQPSRVSDHAYAARALQHAGCRVYIKSKMSLSLVFLLTASISVALQRVSAIRRETLHWAKAPGLSQGTAGRAWDTLTPSPGRVTYAFFITIGWAMALSSAHSLVAICVRRDTQRANANSSSSEEKSDDEPTCSVLMPRSVIVCRIVESSIAEPFSSEKIE